MAQKRNRGVKMAVETRDLAGEEVAGLVRYFRDQSSVGFISRTNWSHLTLLFAPTPLLSSQWLPHGKMSWPDMG